MISDLKILLDQGHVAVDSIREKNSALDFTVESASLKRCTYNDRIQSAPFVIEGTQNVHPNFDRSWFNYDECLHIIIPKDA